MSGKSELSERIKKLSKQDIFLKKDRNMDCPWLVPIGDKNTYFQVTTMWVSPKGASPGHR